MHRYSIVGGKDSNALLNGTQAHKLKNSEILSKRHLSRKQRNREE